MQWPTLGRQAPRFLQQLLFTDRFRTGPMLHLLHSTTAPHHLDRRLSRRIFVYAGFAKLLMPIRIVADVLPEIFRVNESDDVPAAGESIKCSRPRRRSAADTPCLL